MGEQRHIGFEVKTLSNLIKREVDKVMLDHWQDAATANHCRIIGFLYRNRDRDVYQRELEEQFKIRRSTVTQTLQLMEKNGIIQRVSAEHDARMKKIVLTARGEEMHMQGRACIDAFEERLCEGISEEELETFLQIVQKFKNNLTQK